MIPMFKPFMADDVLSYLKPVLSYNEKGEMYIGQGEQVERFERAFQEYCGLKYAPLSLNSGTSALELALQLIGIKPGDEVITTPITCTATNSPIVLYGARPVWADVDPVTGLIDEDDVAQKITPRTKAIIAVNWGGRQPNYNKLKSYGLPVVEDAAHGPYDRKQSGTYVCWSFQAIKHLTCVDGGALYVENEVQLERGRLLRWYGLDRRSSKDFRCEQNIVEVGRMMLMLLSD